VKQAAVKPTDGLERLSKPELLRLVRQLQGIQELAVHQEELHAQNLQLQQIQRALEQSRDRYAELYDFAPVAYSTLNAAGIIQSINLTGAKLLGVARERLIGLPMLQVFEPQDRLSFLEALRRSRENLAEQTAELSVKSFDGRVVPVQLFVHCITDAADSSVSFWLTFNDMSGFRRVEEERRRALLEQQSARTAAELKDQLISVVSHELRTPLSSMLLWSRLLQGKLRGQTEYLQAVDAIVRSAESQRQLIDDLLDMSRITSGKLRLSLQNLDLQALIASSIDLVQPLASAKGVTLESDLNAGVVVVRADAERLQQVFWNLLVNAVKFTPQGGHVRTSVRQIGEEVDVRVVDTGIGIDADFLPHVFEPFRQAETATTTRRHGGLGLGLAISQELVSQHRGSIYASSDGPGQGATFVVRLALAADQSEITPLSLGTESQSAMWAQHSELAGISILIVEDEPETRAALTTMVRVAGAEVTAVSSAGAAIDAFQHARPDVLVSDIGMPVEDGYGLIRRLRALERSTGSQPIRAVALTAFARETDRDKALAAGFDEHLGKPVDPPQLFSMLRLLARPGTNRE
jgi:PAS domain S-box-containing protein